MGWRTSQFNEDLVKNYNKNLSGKGYFLEIDIQNLVNFHKLHNDLPFFPERMKTEKLEANLHDKKEYVIHVKKLKP